MDQFSFDSFPNTDFNQVNLDWLLEQITALKELVLSGRYGVPTGGTTGQVLGKTGDEDFQTGWVDQSGGGSGTGLTEEIKQALLQLARKVAYIDADGANYYQDLYNALYSVEPPASLVSIDAVYTQSGTVYDTDNLYSLEEDLVVTAHYSDGTSAVIPAQDYTLSGTLTVGISTITVSYGGMTDTFSVTVTESPAPPVTLVSIDAVYTQSGTVYDTDSLDSLKADLIVTATYSDSTTAVIPSANYTLSGTLTVGTSTITVTYGGLTDTFTVTVSAAAAPVYQMENGTAAFSGSSYTGRSIAVTNHNHVLYTNENPSTSTSTPGTYALIDPVSSNTVTPNTSNINLTAPLFTIPANTPVVVTLSNISCSAVTSDKWAVALRAGNSSVISTGDMNFSIQSKTVNSTLNSNTNITALFIYTTAGSSSIEFDITVTVGGERWI